jgi:hypothetical protein
VLRTKNNIHLISVFFCLSILVSVAFAQDKAVSENERALNKQEIIDLISNKTVTYFTTVGNIGSSTDHQLQTTFTKTDDSGGTLVAYSGRASSDGKWRVTEESRLVRQYDSVKWGNKPFQSRIVEKSGKYYVRFGTAEDHEIASIKN